jgi:hypothetical protein
MTSRLERAVRAVALAAALFCGLSQAHAAVYRGAWDPAFGSPFTTGDGFAFNLGWRGEATFVVPDSCVPSGSGFVDFLWPNPCGTPQIRDAFVELYNVADAGNTLETINFGFSPTAVLRLRFDDGNLTGLLSWFSSIEFSDTTDTWLSLAFALPPLTPEPGYSGPVLFSKSWECQEVRTVLGMRNHCSLNIDVSDVSGGNAPTFVITRVPEPGTLALLASALLAVGVLARTRPQAGPRRK